VILNWPLRAIWVVILLAAAVAALPVLVPVLVLVLVLVLVPCRSRGASARVSGAR